MNPHCDLGRNQTGIRDSGFVIGDSGFEIQNPRTQNRFPLESGIRNLESRIKGFPDRAPRTVMAKVMVSMPDDLLSEADAEAASGLAPPAARCCGDSLDAALRRRRTRSRGGDAHAPGGVSAHHGAAAAERVKATRPSARAHSCWTPARSSRRSTATTIFTIRARAILVLDPELYAGHAADARPLRTIANAADPGMACAPSCRTSRVDAIERIADDGGELGALDDGSLPGRARHGSARGAHHPGSTTQPDVAGARRQHRAAP